MKSVALVPLLVIAFIAFIIFAAFVFACVVVWKLIQRGSSKPGQPIQPGTPAPPPPAEPPTLPPPPPPGTPGKHFVYVKLLGEIMPIERGEKFEDPLFDMLEQQQLGAVVGGGTMLNEDKTIAYSGIDLELVNLDSALQATRAKLRELGVPPGSTLEYEINGKTQSLPIHES